MNDQKRQRLEAAGWRVGTPEEFLGLSVEEAALLKLRLERDHAEKPLTKMDSEQTLAAFHSYSILKIIRSRHPKYIRRKGFSLKKVT